MIVFSNPKSCSQLDLGEYQISELKCRTFIGLTVLNS